MKIVKSMLNITWLSLFLLAGVSCTKLKDQPYTTILSSQLEPTPEVVSSLVATAYSNWRLVLLDWDGLWRAQELSADQEVIPGRPNGWVDGGVYKRIHEHQWTADEGIVVNTWNRTFAGITSTNRLIYQIESGSLPVTGAAKEPTIAELRAVRAFYYYILCDTYGNVPIVTKFDLPQGFLPAQNTRKEVNDFIVKELIEVIPQLNNKNDVSTYGRFNRWAAYTLLAKMYLNAAVYTGTPEWEKCIQACDAVINSNAGYVLELDQKNVFKTDNQNSKEIVFAIPLDENYTNNWNAFDLHMQSLSPENQATYNLLSSPWGGMSAIPQFISTFDPEDSRFQKNWIKGLQFSSDGKPILGTMGATTNKPLAYVNEIPSIAFGESVHGLRLGKFEIKQGAAVQLSNDFPVFRYADVLMMKAESLLRTGKEDAAAVIVTQVRQRAFANPAKASVTGAQLKLGSTYSYGRRDVNVSTMEGGADIMFGRFLDELGWEFDQEARRRQDMIRFGVFHTKSWFSHSAHNDIRKTLFPIPRAELQKNSNLKQNAGY